MPWLPFLPDLSSSNNRCDPKNDKKNKTNCLTELSAQFIIYSVSKRNIINFINNNQTENDSGNKTMQIIKNACSVVTQICLAVTSVNR